MPSGKRTVFIRVIMIVLRLYKFGDLLTNVHDPDKELYQKKKNGFGFWHLVQYISLRMNRSDRGGMDQPLCSTEIIK